MSRLRTWARTIKLDALALYLAARDPRTPWYAKALALCVAGYAFSPVDLIPDFIPVLGLLDDLLLVPLGIALVFKLIPAEVIASCRERAALEAGTTPRNWWAAAVIASAWLALLAVGLYGALRLVRP